jgi:GNAT superfamily N-acetyltransferase
LGWTHFLLLDREKALGCYSLFRPLNSPTIGLADLTIRPELRGSGLGTLLIEDAFARASRTDAEHMVLSAAEKAVGLYERMGWKELWVNVWWGCAPKGHALDV